MLNKALACIATIGSVMLATSASAELTTKFDRFKNRTEVESRKGPMTTSNGVLDLSWAFTYPGEQMKAKPSLIHFFIVVGNKSWEYLQCHSLAFLADGKPVPIDSTKHHGTAARGFVVESINSIMKTASLRQLAKAQKVEMQLCRTEYTFDDEDLKALREIADALN